MPVYEVGHHYATSDGTRFMGEYEAHMYQFHGKVLHPTHVDFDGVADAWKNLKASNEALKAALAARRKRIEKAKAKIKYDEIIQNAKQGNIEAMVTVAELCMKHLERYNEALEWYGRIADQGYEKEGLCGIGDVFHKVLEHEQAIEWYQKAVDKGYAIGLCRIGNIYFDRFWDYYTDKYDSAVSRDRKNQSVEWFQKALEFEGPNALTTEERKEALQRYKFIKDILFQEKHSSALAVISGFGGFALALMAGRWFLGTLIGNTNTYSMGILLAVMLLIIIGFFMSLRLRLKFRILFFATLFICNLYFSSAVLPEYVQMSKNIITELTAEKIAPAAGLTATLKQSANLLSNYERGNMVKSLNKGDTVTITGDPVRNFVPVRHEGTDGWISLFNIRVNNP
jgi:tetratricopeptide (TPR) repeat protein